MALSTTIQRGSTKIQNNAAIDRDQVERRENQGEIVVFERAGEGVGS